MERILQGSFCQDSLVRFLQNFLYYRIESFVVPLGVVRDCPRDVLRRLRMCNACVLYCIRTYKYMCMRMRICTLACGTLCFS